jgi:hypothetical protein
VACRFCGVAGFELGKGLGESKASQNEPKNNSGSTLGKDTFNSSWQVPILHLIFCRIVKLFVATQFVCSKTSALMWRQRLSCICRWLSTSHARASISEQHGV